MIIVTSCRFRKAPFSKCFPSTLERKADDFKVLRFEDRFRKAAFSVRVSVDGSSYRRNKAAFSNLSGNVVGFFSMVKTVTISNKESFFANTSFT